MKGIFKIYGDIPLNDVDEYSEVEQYVLASLEKV